MNRLSLASPTPVAPKKRPSMARTPDAGKSPLSQDDENRAPSLTARSVNPFNKSSMFLSQSSQPTALSARGPLSPQFARPTVKKMARHDTNSSKLSLSLSQSQETRSSQTLKQSKLNFAPVSSQYQLSQEFELPSQGDDTPLYSQVMPTLLHNAPSEWSQSTHDAQTQNITQTLDRMLVARPFSSCSQESDDALDRQVAATNSKAKHEPMHGRRIMASQGNDQEMSSQLDVCTPADQPIRSKNQLELAEEMIVSKHDNKEQQFAIPVLRSKNTGSFTHIAPPSARKTMSLTGRAALTSSSTTLSSSLGQMATAQSYPTPQQNYFLAKKSDKTDVKKGITVTPSRLHQDFEVLEELGAGAFGQVYRCRHRLDGSEYAVKKMKSKIRGDGMKRDQCREVFALSALQHQHNYPASLIRYHNAWIDDSHLFVQTEFCSGGNLNVIDFDETMLLSMCLQLCQALEFMHKCGMCHLDVKPDNILLAAPLSFGVAPQFKLADFGLTVPLYGADSPLERGELHAEGDRKFCSREIMSGRLSAETLMSADIFALGLTIYALARGSQFGPLPDDGPQWEQLRYGVLPTLPRSPDKQSTLLQDDSVLMNVIQSMIQPEQRPTASELVFYLTAHFNEPTPTGDVITPSESKTLDLLSPTPNTSQPSVRMDEQSVSKQNLFKQQPSPIPCSPFLSPGAVPFSVQKSTVTPTPFQSQTLNYVSPGNVSTPAHNVTADWWVAEIAQLKAQLMAQQVETQRLEAIVLSI